MELTWAARLWIGVSCVLLHVVVSQGTATCATIGDTAELSCNVILPGGLTLRTTTWRKLGSPDVVVADLTGAAPAYVGRATVNSTGFLLLENIQETDLATYRCDASLSNFTALPVVETKLQIASPPKNVTCPSNVTVDEFQTITIVCATTACPTATIEWENLPSDITPAVTDNEVSVTFDVRKADEGIFICKAVSSLGEGTCQTTFTVPNYQPIIEASVPQKAFAVDILEGRITISVEVVGNPRPVITWVREGYPNQTGNSLVITSDMAGQYSCWTSNDIGEVSCGTFTVVLTVWKLVLVIAVPVAVVVAIGCGVGGYCAGRRKKKGESNSPVEADTCSSVSSVHGNNASKSEVVCMIKEGQSHQVKLPPIKAKQNPAQKKRNKKKKKLNEVHATDEDDKPEG